MTPSIKREEHACKSTTVIISRTFMQELYVQSWKSLS